MQPMYYHLGHFSKFVPPGSQRISVTSSRYHSLEFIGFVTPQSNTILVVLNTQAKSASIGIRDSKAGMIFDIIPAFSIQTYIW